MRAVWLREFGPPEVLVVGDAPDPEPGPGQTLVDVVVAGVTFVETQARAGLLPFYSREALPLIPGNGVAGTVAAVGKGVDPALIGRRVVTSTGGTGGYAERAAVPVEALIAIPDRLDLPQAVALLADGRTAMALSEAARIAPGEQVLVMAAGGGVGSLLVQRAALAGARVIAAAGDARKLALARDLEAEVTVNYAEPGWDERVRAATGGAGVDVAFDGVGGALGRGAFELVAPNGRFLFYGLASGALTEATLAEVFERNLIVSSGTQIRSPAHNRELTEAALAEAQAGRLRPTIGQVFPLDRAAEAHAAIEARATLGKTLLIR